MEGAAPGAAAERAGPLNGHDELPTTRPSGPEPAELRATVRPERTLAPVSEALALLAEPHALRMQGVLGKGGMATVYAARQVALGRTVAVKVPDGDLASPRIAGMLAEAVVTGQLEHPGIVPVHTLDVDEAGRPRLVLKRIEGESWSSLLAGDDPATRSDERLAEHLRITLRVSEALAFAHSRGIIHRDVKPDNVMVGRFGEVYLLDWGIAVTLDDEADPRVPRLSYETGSAGTPHYMAPELAAARRDEQGPATDVFLLAATLYEVLTGRPPYSGRTALAVMTAASRGAIEPLPDTVDGRLGALCLQAMAHDPADRPQSATAFAEGIRRWLEQRPAWRLLHDAARRVDALEAAAADGSGDRMAHEAAFDHVRTTLAQVEALLPAETVESSRGRAAAAIARIALADGDAEAAHLRLTLPGTRIAPETVSELRLAITRMRREAARREQEAARTDRRLGRSLRGWAAFTLGAAWVLLPVSSAVQGVMPDLRTVGTSNAVLGVVVLAIFAARWQHLGRTVPNRLLMVCFLIASFGFGALDLWGYHRGLAPELVYVVHLPMVAIASAIFAVGVESRAWPLIVTTLAATAIGGAWPEQVIVVTAVNNFCIWFGLVYVSLRPSRARA